MKDKLSYAEMVALVDNILDPKDYTSEEINLQLIQFCAALPDPLAAMKIVLETMPPTTASQLVDKALACKVRSISEIPESELPLSHPLRFVN